MNSRKIDRTMLLIGVVLILISSRQLFWSSSFQSDSLSLGKISAKRSVVKSKGVRGLDWQDAFLNAPVSHNQLIYTDNQSSARISLNTGIVIDVEENSLIKIQQASDLDSVALEKGFLTTKLSGQTLRLQLGQQEVVLNSSDAMVQISQDGNSGEIGILSGEVELHDGKTIRKMDPSQLVRVDGKNISSQNVVFNILSPKRGEKIYLKGASTAVKFQWTPGEEGEVSLEDMGGNSIPVTSRTVNLGPGSYRWKVKSSSGTSLDTPFNLIQVQTPQILRPLSGEKIRLAPKEGGPGKLALQWETSAPAVEVELIKSLKSESFKTTESSHIVDIDSSGSFQWRLRNIYDDTQIVEWTEWQKIDVEILEFPRVPHSLAPKGAEFQFYQKEGWQVSLSWRNPLESEIEIQSPDGQSETMIIKGQELNYIPQLSGEYQWRLRSQDEFGRQSQWTEWSKFKVKDLSEEVIKDAQRIQLERPNQEVKFSWEGEESENVFEISKDRNFKEDVLLRKVNGSSASVRIPEIGVYYWRSRRYLPNGKIEVNEPRKVIIEPNAAPAKPKPLPATEIPLEWKSVQTNFFDFFMSSAHADEFEGQVKIALPVHPNAKTYIVKILSSSGKTLLTRVLPSPEFHWENALPGEYQWQYAIKDYWGRESEFSDPSRLVIKKPEVRRALLAKPIRAEEVSEEIISFEWSIPRGVKNFGFEVSSEDDFSRILSKENLAAKRNSTSLSEKVFPESGLYYWRVLSHFPDGRVKPSSTGRFKLVKKPQVPGELKEKTNTPRRLMGLLWTPSIDTYSFQDNSQEGEIDGQNILSTNLYVLNLGEKFFYSASLGLGRGKVFKGEDYSTAQLTLSGGYTFKLSFMELGAGIRGGFLRANTYSIQNNKVKGKSISAFQYGPSFFGLIPLNYGKGILVSASYLLGEVQEIATSADLLFPWKDFFLQGGLGFSSRSFNENSGEQTSLSLRLGISKSF